MKLSVHEQDGVTIIELRGNLMGEPEDEAFYNTLKELIDKNKIKVVADLTKVDWINSRGLGILISGLTAMRNHGGELKLACASEKVKSLLVLTRLITAFESHEFAKDAIQSFR